MDSENNVTQTVFCCYEVQRKITTNVSLGDLKSLRLVSKLWRHAGIAALKDKCLVTLDSPEAFQHYLNFLEEQGDNDDEYLCFSNYRIIIKPEKFVSLNQALLLFLEFWKNCSGEVKELSFRFPWTACHPILTHIYRPFYLDNSTRSGLDIGLEKLSLSLDDNVVSSESEGDGNQWTVDEAAENIERDIIGLVNNSSLISLHLNVSIVLNSEKKVFPFTWDQFVQTCPNICHLSIQSDYASVHFVRLINSLVERKVILKTLQIGTRDQRLFSDEFLKQIVYLTGSETRTVSLGFLPSVKHNTPLDFLLHQSCSSLTQLTFLQLRTSNQGAIQSFMASDTRFCTGFPNLTSLRITKDLVPNLAFLVKMPNLKRLEIFRDSTIGQHDDLSNPVIRTRSLSVVMHHLQSLTIEVFVPLEHVWKLTNWFPNLKRLQMQANDLIARVIFTKWTELRELYLIGEISRDNNDIIRSSLTDEGITGRTKEQLQLGSGGVREVAYIGDLTKLEVCKLQVVPDYLTGLTDYSIHLGLADLPALKNVCLVKTLVSPAAADSLREASVQVTVIKE